MLERPQNLRPARSADHTDNSHSSQYGLPQADGPQTRARAYRGSHRAERLRRPADLRSSRVGGHHDQPQDSSRHW